MSTFLGSNGTMAMFMAVAEQVDRIDALVDVHTVTLVLNGQHGEFDLVVEATDMDEMEEHRWEGIAHRMGGVTDFKEVEVR